MVPLFESLSSETLDELARSSILRRYPLGQILCNEGDPGESLIVLESGSLRVSRLLASGDEAVLAVMDAPAALGELALLDGAPRDATVTAQRDVTIRLIPRTVFMELLRHEPAAVEGLLRRLAGLVRQANARHADFIGLDVPGRLANWLLRQAGARDGIVPPGTVITLRSSQGELAGELGTTRSTLNRALRGFESLGLIRVDGAEITLDKPDRLVGYTW
jgi:CRP-like cAMP-binding protein